MKLLVVDDSPVMRLGLVTLLDGEPDIEVVGEAADGDEALTQACLLQPDVVLLDVRMPRRDGLSVVGELSRISTVLMVTFTDDHDGIRRALREGAAGYLVHGTFDAQALASMVRVAAAGVTALTAPARAAMAAPVEARPSVPSAVGKGQLSGLSQRQRDVMALIALGRSNSQIARELFLAEKTVKNHINQIFAVLGVTSRAEAIVCWLGQE